MMKRLSTILVLVLLFASAFGVGRSGRSCPAASDSLRLDPIDTLSPRWLYTEGIKAQMIHRDTARARHYFRRTIERDSLFAPAYFQLFLNNLYSSEEEGVALAHRAWRIDSLNNWYLRMYGQSLVFAHRYKDALRVYERLVSAEPDEPDNYRILAALYEQDNNPYIALTTLDSAELRCGQIPYFTMIKRRLLIATNQLDRAIEEQQALVASDPYAQQYHIEMGDLYGLAHRDSMALKEYDFAIRLDSTAIAPYLALGAFHNDRADYPSMLQTFKRVFKLPNVALEEKIRHIETFTQDVRFYGNFFGQITDLMNTLAIMYPKEKKVVDLYTGHLIAAGEVEQALNFMKAHLDDEPVERDYYMGVIDMESYLERPDSARLYTERALRLFPDDLALRLTKGNVEFQAKRYDAALATYKEALRYADADSTRSSIWCIIGDTHHEKARKAGVGAKPDPKLMKPCYSAYKRSLKYNPRNIVVLNNYAYFLSVEERDLETALSLSARVLEEEPDNATYIDTYAWILYKLGRYDEAKQSMRQAIALDRRGSADLMVHYGDILFALKEYFLAENYWRKALNGGFDPQAIAERIMNLKHEKEQRDE